jgi:hypothetical protein
VYTLSLSEPHPSTKPSHFNQPTSHRSSLLSCACAHTDLLLQTSTPLHLTQKIRPDRAAGQRWWSAWRASHTQDRAYKTITKIKIIKKHNPTETMNSKLKPYSFPSCRKWLHAASNVQPACIPYCFLPRTLCSFRLPIATHPLHHLLACGAPTAVSGDPELSNHRYLPLPWPAIPRSLVFLYRIVSSVAALHSPVAYVVGMVVMMVVVVDVLLRSTRVHR